MYSCRGDIDFSVPGSSRANRACSWAMSAWEDLWTFCVYKDKKRRVPLRLSGSRSRTWDGGGLARLACCFIDLNAMARLTYLLIVVLLVLGAVPTVMATRRKPKRRPVEPDDGGDRGTAAPGTAGTSSPMGVANPDAASQNARYLYCNDTVSAAGSSTAAGSGALPVGGSGCSGGPATMQGTPTVVELTWRTADARLTLQTDSPAMVEAAEWSAAVSRDPPPARPDRSSAAAQVADRVAGLRLGS